MIVTRLGFLQGNHDIFRHLALGIRKNKTAQGKATWVGRTIQSLMYYADSALGRAIYASSNLRHGVTRTLPGCAREIGDSDNGGYDSTKRLGIFDRFISCIESGGPQYDDLVHDLGVVRQYHAALTSAADQMREVEKHIVPKVFKQQA